MMQTQSSVQSLAIPNQRSTKVIPITDITHLHASSNYTYIYHNEKYELASRTLRHYHEQLDQSVFIRPHQSYAVNVMYISSIDFGSSTIYMHDGLEIPISRARKKEIKQFFSS